jgi:hypothetical protein
VPLVLGASVIGVLFAADPSERPFDRDESSFQEPWQGTPRSFSTSPTTKSMAPTLVDTLEAYFSNDRSLTRTGEALKIPRQHRHPGKGADHQAAR